MRKKKKTPAERFKVLPWHREMMRQVYVGRKVEDIAASLDRSVAVCRRAMGHAKWKEAYRAYETELTAVRLDPRERFGELAPKAVEVLEEVMTTAEDFAQRRLAANDILDRAGYPRTTKVEGEQAPKFQIGTAQINVLVAALKESGRDVSNLTALGIGARPELCPTNE